MATAAPLTASPPSASLTPSPLASLRKMAPSAASPMAPSSPPQVSPASAPMAVSHLSGRKPRPTVKRSAPSSLATRQCPSFASESPPHPEARLPLENSALPWSMQVATSASRAASTKRPLALRTASGCVPAVAIFGALRREKWPSHRFCSPTSRAPSPASLLYRSETSRFPMMDGSFSSQNSKVPLADSTPASGARPLWATSSL